MDDLRQMYAYCRFWNAEKAMLLYPGDFKTNRFQVFETDDYSVGQAGILKIDHQCKMGFVSVLNEENNDLDSEIGEIILKLLIAS